jgi:hypothetical protein
VKISGSPLSLLQRPTALMLLGKQSLVILRIMQKAQIHFGGKVQDFVMLKQVQYIVTFMF